MSSLSLLSPGRRDTDLFPVCPVHLLCVQLSPTTEMEVGECWDRKAPTPVSVSMCPCPTVPSRAGGCPSNVTGTEKGWREDGGSKSILCCLQAGMCHIFLKSNPFNPSRKPPRLEFLLHFTDACMFFLPKSSQPILPAPPPPGRLPGCPPHSPSSKLPVLVGAGPGLPSQTDCWLLLHHPGL